MRFFNQVALLLALAAAGAAVEAPAQAAGGSPGASRIAFYADFGNDVDSQKPLFAGPSQVLLAEDGSVALNHLRWSGWGTSVAQAAGEWSASDCTPDCADGKVTTSPARLTLSSPGIVRGHLVYRCVQVTPPHPQRDMLDHGCLHRDGTSYGY